MILLRFAPETATAPPRVVALFGSGLIGSAIAQAVRRRGACVAQQRLAWSWPQPEPSQTRAIEAAIRAPAKEQPGLELSVIWAAGQSGFGSSEEVMAQEFDAFAGVRLLARRLALICGPEAIRFYHLSSAGGLFEGQVGCDGQSQPCPIRPYGFGKLNQEAALDEDVGLGHRVVIRPSSVYGYAAGGRHGLISALISAALRRRDAKIFGAMTTQRDFILATDIGRYIAKRVFAPVSKSEEVERLVLASGRPASVFEIIKLVENNIGSQLYLKIDPRPDNARDNTFRPSALPPDFYPTPLHEGVEQTKVALMASRA